MANYTALQYQATQYMISIAYMLAMYSLIGGTIKPVFLPQTESTTLNLLYEKWLDRGVDAGQHEGWLNMEETLPETLQRYPKLCNTADDLIKLDQEEWEQTDHFNILYGNRMMKDAKLVAEDMEDAFDIYQDLKDKFWEGYIYGRKQSGIDIYKIAEDLIKQKNRSI